MMMMMVMVMMVMVMMVMVMMVMMGRMMNGFRVYGIGKVHKIEFKNEDEQLIRIPLLFHFSCALFPLSVSNFPVQSVLHSLKAMVNAAAPCVF